MTPPSGRKVQRLLDYPIKRHLVRFNPAAAFDLADAGDQRVALGGYVNAGEYMRQLIRSDATERHDRRLGDGLAARESGRGDTPDGDAR